MRNCVSGCTKGDESVSSPLGREKSSKKKEILKKTPRFRKDKTSCNNSSSLTPKDSIGQPSPDKGYDTSLSSTSVVEETERNDNLGELGYTERPIHD